MSNYIYFEKVIVDSDLDKKFDLDEFRNKVHAKEYFYEEELSYYASYRAEPLLMVNYVESLVKDFIVVFTKSEKAREINRRTINKILLDRKIIDKELFDDIEKTFQIRDLYAHNLSLSQVDTENKKILKNMNATQLEKAKWSDWDQKQIEDQIAFVARSISDKLHKILEQILEEQITSGKERKLSDTN